MIARLATDGADDDIWEGAIAATVERLRRGTRFETIIQTIQRLKSLQIERKSPWPRLDAFFVPMRSNYREIPQFTELMKSVQRLRFLAPRPLTDRLDYIQNGIQLERLVLHGANVSHGGIEVLTR